ncbi:MAG: GNAT family N-acetyltransferase [Chloroflexi bacterium]|nr:GNAT family N-acetyltransferase [Chloroflexota bacterium]
MSIIAIGATVRLRQKRLEDGVNDYAWSTDPELSKLDATKPINIGFREYLIYYKDRLKLQDSLRNMYAIETMDGKHIGNCTYYNIDEKKKETEIGIMIGDRRYWNHGYGYESIMLLIHHVFATTKLNRLYLHVLDWNLRGKKSFIKSGFVECGLSEKGIYHFIVMELYRDWIKKEDVSNTYLPDTIK